MTKKLLSLVTIASFIVTLTSCLGDGNDSGTVYYDDTAISAFSLGTLNIEKHTTASDGVTDSTYKSTYSASSYKFYIDQQRQLIYNPDSLPYGTDAKHVVCSFSTKNSGTVVLNLKDAQGADSLAAYASTDSLDFSEPIRVRVYNMSGTAYRQYTVSVNIHRQTGYEMTWASTSYSALGLVGNRRMAYNNGQLYLFGEQGGQTVGYKLTGDSWQQLSSSMQLAADAYRSLIAKDGYLYVLSNGSVLRSADGQTWSQTAQGTTLTQLLGASDAALYALSADGIASSKDNGATWTADALDDAAANLPSTNVNLVCIPSKTNELTNDLVVVGTRDGVTRVWRKVEENADNAQAQPWAFYPDDEYNKKQLPALDNLQVVGYDNGLLALGGDFSTFYYSPDEGLTWTADNSYKLPTTFGRTATPFAMTVDASNFIYISTAASTDTWSARLARLGWTTDQKEFTK